MYCERVSILKKIKTISKSWCGLLLILTVLIIIYYFSVRPIILANAVSKAKNVLTNAVNEAVVTLLKENNIAYDDIAVVSRTDSGDIKGIEIDVNKSNYFKSALSNEIYKILEKNDIYYFYVPFGDFLLNDLTNGFGPRIKLRMQIAHSENLDFNSVFTDAGINNVLHQITVKIKMRGSVLAFCQTKGFTVETTALVAQTVIAGSVPESFTNVDEYPGSDIADEIFNYADK